MKRGKYFAISIIAAALLIVGVIASLNATKNHPGEVVKIIITAPDNTNSEQTLQDAINSGALKNLKVVTRSSTFKFAYTTPNPGVNAAGISVITEGDGEISLQQAIDKNVLCPVNVPTLTTFSHVPEGGHSADEIKVTIGSQTKSLQDAINAKDFCPSTAPANQCTRIKVANKPNVILSDGHLNNGLPGGTPVSGPAFDGGCGKSPGDGYFEETADTQLHICQLAMGRTDVKVEKLDIDDIDSRDNECFWIWDDAKDEWKSTNSGGTSHIGSLWCKTNSCTNVCGNGTKETGEVCDFGNPDGIGSGPQYTGEPCISGEGEVKVSCTNYCSTLTTSCAYSNKFLA